MKRKAMVVTGFMLAAWLLGQLGNSARAWQVTLSPGRLNRAYAVAVDSAGDVLVTGEADFRDSQQNHFTVVKLSGTNGALLWRQDIQTYWVSSDVAVDSAGDVVATAYRGGGTVFKLSGDDGTELWWQKAPGGRVVIDGDDNVITGGVAKLSGTDGSVLWSNGAYGNTDQLAIDSDGNVFAGYADGVVAKLAGTTGAEIWSRDLGWGFDHVSGIAVDDSGVVATLSPRDPWSMIKLSREDGAELWHTDLSRVRNVMVVDGAGDVVGAVSGQLTFRKFSGLNGTMRWQRTISGDGRVHEITIDANGDVVGAGVIYNEETKNDFMVVRLRGSNGAEIWRREIDGSEHERHREEQWRDDIDRANGVTIDPVGNVIAAGALATGRPSSPTLMAVRKFTGTYSGDSLVVRDKDGDPALRTLYVRSKAKNIACAPQGSAGDPIVGGALLELFNATTGERGAMPLPAANWGGMATHLAPWATGIAIRMGKQVRAGW